MKTCTRCEVEKPIQDFVRNRSKSGGYGSYCKACYSTYIKDWKARHPESVRKSTKKSSSQYKEAWLSFFNDVYGEDPTCEVCGRALAWYSDRRENGRYVVHFDHRQGGDEEISINPKQWTNIRPCNETNRLIWNECDFGILCNRCNTYLPTRNRKKWLARVIQYVYQPSARVLTLTEKCPEPLDWNY